MSLKTKIKALWKDESAQGATEYILILVAVVTVAFMFKKQITSFIDSRLSNLGSGLNSFNVEQ
ncbi:MAG: Flp1 family type IVb pilin [Bdellovibrionales bacterium]|jgi:Flp pilus assembly pilin Flp|nr:Flp1 family type IVb pilin [Bdellovibrionales bacterium]